MTSSMTQSTSMVPSPNANWYVPAQFYDLKPLNLSPAQQVRIVPTPPASPNLCIIQEENVNVLCPQRLHSEHQTHNATQTLLIMNTDEPIAPVPTHPQISVTDVQGSEVTLVALSDQSHDSEDSLEAQNLSTMQGEIAHLNLHI